MYIYIQQKECSLLTDIRCYYRHVIHVLEHGWNIFC